MFSPFHVLGFTRLVNRYAFIPHPKIPGSKSFAERLENYGDMVLKGTDIDIDDCIFTVRFSNCDNKVVFSCYYDDNRFFKSVLYENKIFPKVLRQLLYFDSLDELVVGDELCAHLAYGLSDMMLPYDEFLAAASVSRCLL